MVVVCSNVRAIKKLFILTLRQCGVLPAFAAEAPGLGGVAKIMCSRVTCLHLYFGSQDVSEL